MRVPRLFLPALLLFVLFICQNSFAQTAPGIFEGQTDVGTIKLAGNTSYDAKSQHYTITGSGANIWATHDGFHYVWRRIKGDFILTTRAAFLGKGTEMHRKLGWMVRSSLDSCSKHVSAVVHGDGLTSLQYRRTDGAVTEEIRSKITGADVIQLERKGNKYTMWVARSGDTLVTEHIDSLNLGDEVYVGLFVCSHNANVSEKAEFNNVRIVTPARPFTGGFDGACGTSMELLDVKTLNSRIIYQSPNIIQAPNFLNDGQHLVFNTKGLLYKFDLKQNTVTKFNTGSVIHNNNDHVLSFDGKWYALSNSENGSVGYVVSSDGGEPRLISPKTGFSYLHGWSPDGKYLLFTGMRNGDFDIIRVPSAGGDEEANLTKSPGLDDGSEYSPDGKYIYFCSTRTGLMQVWRMKPDGSEPTQITTDDYDNWFPHISPDGKWMEFLSFIKSEVAYNDHPPFKHVYLRVMPVGGGPIKVVAYLYGGQGTINTPSWSPDSRYIAFMSNTNLFFPIFPQEQ